MRAAALKIATNHNGDIGPPKAIARRVATLALHLQLPKMVLHAANIAIGIPEY
jgi:hypothetical protein